VPPGNQTTNAAGESSRVARLPGWAASVPAQVVLFALVTRLAIAFINWYVLRLIPPPWQGASPTSVIAWSQWDAAHYTRIAVNGYDHATDPGNPAFFPLYPLLSKGFGFLTGLDDSWQEMQVAGVMLSWASFLVAIALLTRLFQRLAGDSIARTAGVLLAVTPFSFFLTAGYTEALFLVFVALAFLFAHDRRWGWAAVAVAFATASRVTGVFLIPAILLMAWQQRVALRTLLTITLVSPLGMLAYMAYTWRVLDDPFAFLSAQEGWGGFYDRTGIYIKGFLDHPVKWFFGDNSSPIITLNVLVSWIWLATLIPMYRVAGMGITVFSVLITLQAGLSFHSLGRYLLPAIGVYLVFGTWLQSPRVPGIVRDAVIVCSVVLMTGLLLLFSQAEWIV
jgi:hypothetical protein